MLKNTASFNCAELSAILGPDNIINCPPDLKCSSLTIDSRMVQPGALFVALKGSRLDGHEKAIEAFEKGAAAVLLEKEYYESHIDDFSGKAVMISDSNLLALGKLGHYHRMRFNIPIITIGGANGKTTTKDMTAHLLSRKYNTHKTYANFNNQLGTPLVLLQLNDKHEAAVIEIATNEPGEIAVLSEMAAPTQGLITNIGEEHLELLIDLTGVELEETFMFGYLHKQDGYCFINIDDERLARYSKIIENNITYGTSEGADVRFEFSLDSDLHPEIKFFAGNEEFSAKMKTIGYTTALNAAAATAIALGVGMNREEITEGLETFEPDRSHDYGRMLLEKIPGITLINDCYNANPSSMKPALKTLQALETRGNKIAVLGDMRELGDSSREGHEEILKMASEVCDEVITFGPEMKAANSKINFDNVISTVTKEDTFKAVKDIVKENDAILVKGSRGLKMEEVVIKLKEIFS